MMIQFILRSELLEGQAIRLLWQCVVSTVLLKRNPLIDIKKRQYIRIHNLIDVGIGSKTALDCMKGGFSIKGDSTRTQIITLPHPCLSLISIQAGIYRSPRRR